MEEEEKNKELIRWYTREVFDDGNVALTVDVRPAVSYPDQNWTLPTDDDEYSVRWAAIKETFTREFLKKGGTEGAASRS